MPFSLQIAYDDHNVFIVVSISFIRLSCPERKILTQFISAQSEASSLKCQPSTDVLIK